MAELLNLLFHPLPNAVMTILTGISMLYWVFVFLSGTGFSFDTDADVEGLGDVQDVEGTEVAPDGFFGKAMEYINVGKVPIMVIVTLFKFISWIITIVSSFFVSFGKFGAWSLLVLIPIFIIVYFLMHWLTKPLARFYDNIGYKGEEAIDFLGRKGVMRSSISGNKLGSAEFRVNNAVIRLNVRSQNGSPINYKDEIVVIDEADDKKTYLVQKEITIHNINT